MHVIVVAGARYFEWKKVRLRSSCARSSISSASARSTPSRACEPVNVLRVGAAYLAVASQGAETTPGAPRPNAGNTVWGDLDQGKPPDTAADSSRVRHAHGRTGREEAARGRRLGLRAEVRRLPGADHQGQAASGASIQEEQGPHRDVSGNRGGRPAVEGGSSSSRR